MNANTPKQCPDCRQPYLGEGPTCGSTKCGPEEPGGFEDIGDIDGEHEAAIESHYAAIVDEWERAARTGAYRRGALALGYYRGICEASKDMASRTAAEHAVRRWFDECGYRCQPGGGA